ncbi:hypothetical protein GQ53DRAFT_833197 [Thozetella sp. PMI_491]|nr:hypothetical protein GQ53DRAFT_833197 [Thozetella sp. PMI_491]
MDNLRRHFRKRRERVNELGLRTMASSDSQESLTFYPLHQLSTIITCTTDESVLPCGPLTASGQPVDVSVDRLTTQSAEEEQRKKELVGNFLLPATTFEGYKNRNKASNPSKDAVKSAKMTLPTSSDQFMALSSNRERLPFHAFNLTTNEVPSQLVLEALRPETTTLPPALRPSEPAASPSDTTSHLPTTGVLPFSPRYDHQATTDVDETVSTEMESDNREKNRNVEEKLEEVRRKLKRFALEPPASEPALCATCDKETKLGCSHCQDISYCSTECQKADWSCHGMLCSQFAICQDEHRPLPTAVRAILFEPYEDYPTFQWLEIGDDETFDLSEWFQGDNKAEAQLYRELPRNKCIDNLGSTHGLTLDWRGPVLAASFDGGDINMRDFRAIVDYFQSNPKNIALVDPSRFQGNQIYGLRLNCDDAMAEFGVSRGDPVMLSEDMVQQPAMPPFHERLTIFEPMGLSFRFRWAPAIQATRGKNRHFFLTHVSAALEKGGIYLSEMERLRGEEPPRAGTIVMWRHDHRRLLRAHIMALDEWMYSYATVIANRDGLVTKTNLDYVCTRANFEWFWPGFVQEQGWSDRKLPSPFEV